MQQSRGTVQFCLLHDDKRWLKITDVRGKTSPEYPGAGWLARSEYARYSGHFYLHKRESRGRKNQRSRGRLSSPTREKASAKEPWLTFTSTEEFKPLEIMKLYSRRMQIEQNFCDEKSERFGFGLRPSYSRSAGRLLVLSLPGDTEHNRAVAYWVSC
ncbi:transposase [Escherichia coli]|nr:transposase [Escherichia coli]